MQGDQDQPEGGSAWPAASWLLAQRLVRPIRTLARAAERIGAGSYHARVPVPIAGDELAALGGAFNQMARMLESTERRRQALLADLAHELRTPLATLEGYVEGLADGVVAADQQAWTVLGAPALAAAPASSPGSRPPPPASPPAADPTGEPETTAHGKERQRLALNGTSRPMYAQQDRREGGVMTTTGTDTADEGQIRAVIADRATAMRERDAERFVAHYAPQIVKFDLAPPLLLTGPQARDAEALRAWFASHPGGPISTRPAI